MEPEENRTQLALDFLSVLGQLSIPFVEEHPNFDPVLVLDNLESRFRGAVGPADGQPTGGKGRWVGRLIGQNRTLISRCPAYHRGFRSKYFESVVFAFPLLRNTR